MLETLFTHQTPVIKLYGIFLTLMDHLLNLFRLQQPTLCHLWKWAVSTPCLVSNTCQTNPAKGTPSLSTLVLNTYSRPLRPHSHGHQLCLTPPNVFRTEYFSKGRKEKKKINEDLILMHINYFSK